jgi:hypothetical protein
MVCTDRKRARSSSSGGYRSSNTHLVTDEDETDDSDSESDNDSDYNSVDAERDAQEDDDDDDDNDEKPKLKPKVSPSYGWSHFSPGNRHEMGRSTRKVPRRLGT